MSREAPRHSIGGGRGGQKVGRGVVREFDEDYFEVGPGGTPGNDLIEVFLDGVRKPHAVNAHRGDGVVVSYRVDPVTGHVLRDGLDRPKHVRETGKVEFRRCND